MESFGCNLVRGILQLFPLLHSSPCLQVPFDTGLRFQPGGVVLLCPNQCQIAQALIFGCFLVDSFGCNLVPRYLLLFLHLRLVFVVFAKLFHRLPVFVFVGLYHRLPEPALPLVASW